MNTKENKINQKLVRGNLSVIEPQIKEGFLYLHYKTVQRQTSASYGHFLLFNWSNKNGVDFLGGFGYDHFLFSLYLVCKNNNKRPNDTFA